VKAPDTFMHHIIISIPPCNELPPHKVKESGKFRRGRPLPSRPTKKNFHHLFHHKVNSPVWASSFCRINNKYNNNKIQFVSSFSFLISEMGDGSKVSVSFRTRSDDEWASRVENSEWNRQSKRSLGLQKLKCGRRTHSHAFT